MKQVSTSIIGGANGPTSVFVASKKGGKARVPLKHRLQRLFYKQRRKKVISKIIADPHTLDELVKYVKTKYNAVELLENDRKYHQQRKNCKSALVQRYHPELLGEDVKIGRPLPVILRKKFEHGLIM